MLVPHQNHILMNQNDLGKLQEENTNDIDKIFIQIFQLIGLDLAQTDEIARTFRRIN
jgi:hypothetical protein